MFSALWHNLFFDPVYNTLIYAIDIIPGGDVGLAIILATIVVKVVLLPLSLRATETQLALKNIEPKIKEIKEKFKDKREEQARKMMDLYKEAGVNPFASILLLFIQIPVIIALYFSVVFGGGVALPEINTALLYSFIPTPEQVS
ncbi:YidC/Oxa1 family membrane protein insertase, partial [bacterium]|nr:YidC/Oxa1 family membrane protein insertase [bacterium]